MVTLYLLIVARLRNREKNVATLDKVAVDITVVLGTTSMPIHQVLRLGRGAIIELDAMEEDAVSILANNLPVAKGTVVVKGNRIAVRPNCFPGLPISGEWPALRAGQGPDAATKISVSRVIAGLVPQLPICYMAAIIGTTGFTPFRSSPHAVVAELVDALA